MADDKESKVVDNKMSEEERLKMLSDLDKEGDGSKKKDADPDDDQIDEEEEDGEDEEDDPEPDEEEPEEPKENYREKFAASTAENQVLRLKTEKLEQAHEQAASLPEPTDEECLKEYGEEWEDLSDLHKRIVRENLHSRKKQDIVESVNKSVKLDKEFIDKANNFAIDPDTVKQFPGLDGHQEEFIKFASKPTRRALDLEDVASIFVANLQLSGKLKESRKGPLFPRGRTNKQKAKPKGTQLSADALSILRKTNPRKYEQMIRKGKIDPKKILASDE